MGARKGRFAVPSTLCLWLLLMSCAPVYGASEGSLSLPEPSLMNEFLLANCSNWTNPVLGEQTQAPLQVIKCQSFTAKGPCYDFYQIEAPDHACEAPPPRVYSTHHQSVAVWNHKWLATRAFVSLTLWSSFVVIAIALILLCACGIAPPIPDGRDFDRQSSLELGVSSPSSETSKDASNEEEACGMEAEGKESTDDKQKQDHLKKEADFLAFWRKAKKGMLIVLILCSPFAGLAMPRAIRCSVQETWFTLVGPVGSPNPDQGLNQFLAGKNLSLKLCQTDKLNFYVGQLNTSCEQLGQPYAARDPIGEPGRKDLWETPLCFYLDLSTGGSAILVGGALAISALLAFFAVCDLMFPAPTVEYKHPAMGEDDPSIQVSG